MAQTIREAVAVFDDAETLEQAVFALETHGFDRAAFSLLADEATVGAVAGLYQPRQLAGLRPHPGRRRDLCYCFASQARAQCHTGIR